MIHLPWDGIVPASNPRNVIVEREPTGECKVRLYKVIDPITNKELSPFSYELWRIYECVRQHNRKSIDAQIYYEDRWEIPKQKVEIDNRQYIRTVYNLKEMISALHRRKPEHEGLQFHELPIDLQPHVQDVHFTGAIFEDQEYRKVGPRSYHFEESYRDKDIKFTRWSIWDS